LQVTHYYMFEYVKVVLVLVMIIYTAILDVKYREVEPKVWVVFGVPLTLITMYEVYDMILGGTSIFLLSILMGISIGVTCGIMFVLAYMELMGGADFFAILVISLAHPWKPFNTYLNILPFFPLSLLANSAVLAVTPAIYHLIVNILKYRRAFKIVEGTPWEKTVLAFIGKPMKVADFLKTKFTYVLESYECINDSFKRTLRLNFKVSEEPEDDRRRIQELVNKGVLKAEDFIWTTEGLPMLLPILLGYILTLTIGDFIMYLIVEILHYIVG